MASPDLLQALREVVGAGQVLTDADLRAPYERDWTGRFGGPSRAVVRPGSAAEVTGVLRVCADRGVGVVPQGGNTGLVGGGVPAGGEIVLSCRRLDDIGPVDRAAGQVTVGAGVTLGALQRSLAGSGLEVGVDLASRDSATLGGMVATDAGGNRVLRQGTMGRQVAGLEAVLGSGLLVSHLLGLAKDSSGYDLAGLLTGSEGTLGVVTAVRLTLLPGRAQQVVALLGVPDLTVAVKVAVSLRDRLGSLRSAELVGGDLVRAIGERRGLAPPLARPAPWLLLVECADDDDPSGPLSEALAACGDALLDTALAREPSRRDALWLHRELAAEVLAELGPPRKLDVSLPLSRLADFEAPARRALGELAPGAALHLFGHILEGNLHCNLLGVPESRGDEVDGALLELAVSLGGSIGAEHGIGRAKRQFLHLVRSPDELAAFRALKQALDPAGIMNPGVLLPD